MNKIEEIEVGDVLKWLHRSHFRTAEVLVINTRCIQLRAIRNDKTEAKPYWINKFTLGKKFNTPYNLKIIKKRNNVNEGTST